MSVRVREVLTDEQVKRQAVDAIYFRLGTLIRKAADEHDLDRLELFNAVWRKITIDVAGAHAKPFHILVDMAEILKEMRTS